MRPGKKSPAPAGDHKIFDTLRYNDTLTLSGIPAEAFRYRLGTRSALEWVIDQYQVKTDRRSGIVSDPNAWSEAQQYIVDLVGRVVAVSMHTVRLVDDPRVPPAAGVGRPTPPTAVSHAPYTPAWRRRSTSRRSSSAATRLYSAGALCPTLRFYTPFTAYNTISKRFAHRMSASYTHKRKAFP